MPQSRLYMSMGTLLRFQKTRQIWAWGHSALAKSSLCMGMRTLGSAKKPPIYGHGDALRYQKSPNMWMCGHVALPKRAPYRLAWGHSALAKSSLCMGMGTFCMAKKPPI